MNDLQIYVTLAIFTLIALVLSVYLAVRTLKRFSAKFSAMEKMDSVVEIKWAAKSAQKLHRWAAIYAILSASLFFALIAFGIKIALLTRL